MLPEIVKLLKKDLLEVCTAFTDRLYAESVIFYMSNHYKVPRP